MSEPIDYEKQALAQAVVQHVQEGINLRTTILVLQAENARLTEQIAKQKPEKPAPVENLSDRPSRVSGSAR